MSVPSSLHDFQVCAWRTVSFRASDMAAAAAAMSIHHPDRVIVESCQRIEAFGFGACQCPAPEHWHGREALLRLGEVAAGLDSVVLGETQILGQVRGALAQATGDLAAVGDVAIAAARQLRREVRFDSHAGHLLDRALKLAGVTPQGTLLVLGTGAMGRLIADRGVALGFSVTVAGRKAPDTKAEWAYVPLSELRTAETFDVVAGCLGSGAGEIRLSALPSAPLALDFGTPRNFAEEPGRRCVTIADLLADEALRPHAARRRTELKGRLAAILDERLSDALGSAKSPLGSLRLEVEAIRQREVERTRRLHPELPLPTIEALTRSLVDQIFHLPTERLRQLDDETLARTFADLFAMDGAR